MVNKSKRPPKRRVGDADQTRYHSRTRSGKNNLTNGN